MDAVNPMEELQKDSVKGNKTVGREQIWLCVYFRLHKEDSAFQKHNPQHLFLLCPNAWQEESSQ